MLELCEFTLVVVTLVLLVVELVLVELLDIVLLEFGPVLEMLPLLLGLPGTVGFGPLPLPPLLTP